MPSNPQLMQMGGQMVGGMMGGKGGQEDPAKLKGTEQTGMGKMASDIDAIGKSFNNFADSEFAETEQYNRQRAEGLPETNKPQLQDVDSPDMNISGMKSGPSMESPDMDTQPVETDSNPIQLDLPAPTEEDEDVIAKRNALKGLIA